VNETTQDTEQSDRTGELGADTGAKATEVASKQQSSEGVVVRVYMKDDPRVMGGIKRVDLRGVYDQVEPGRYRLIGPIETSVQEGEG
jgi:hypothetical protein